MIPYTITTAAAATTTVTASCCCCCCPGRGPGFSPCGNLCDALRFLRGRPVFLLALPLQLGPLPVLLFRRVVHVVLAPVPVLVLPSVFLCGAGGREGRERGE